MDHSQRLELARQVYEARKEETQYLVTWRGGGEHQIYSGNAGFAELTALLGVTAGSLYNYLCGKGIHNFTGTNPTTGETDIGTVTKVKPPAKPKRPRGRPRKVIDWERLGSEAPNHPSGTALAPPAKTMPKDRNRCTDEKQ